MKSWLKQNRGFLIFLVCLGFFRSAMADWNPIPSGSMHPTLLEGDVVLVNRLAYDLKIPLTDISLAELGTPKRGEVITFASPSDGTRLIKRLVAVPGDVVEMRDERLIINGVAADYTNFLGGEEQMGFAGTTPNLRATERIAGSERAVQYLPAVSARRSFGPIVIPKDSFFFLGDNRDNSADSRYIGVVPRQRLIGRAHHVLVSADITGSWLPRFERFGERIL
jgi:signal peptidase I